jgi:tRNA pseudouridine38-40 synthase
VSVRTFRLTLAYDGTEFHGWQVQPGVRTVQGEVERALSEVLQTEAVRVHGAGRTDTGVHARGQVASFSADTSLPARAWPPLLGRRLPHDVRVVDAGESPAGFHARHSALARRYVYRLLDRPDVLLERFAWWPGRAPAFEALAASAPALEGVHDCSSFRAVGSAPADPVCRVDCARWHRWEGGAAFEVQANHFLYHMVRNLVGTALAVAGAADPAGALREIREARDRGLAGITAPPQGLCLEAVVYGESEA